MTNEYHSFLVCFHPGHTDIYFNGLPIGVIRADVFTIHEHTMPDGTKIPAKIPDELKTELANVLSRLT